MNPESLDKPIAPRKVRFAPKAPPRRDRKPILPKVEKVEEADDDAAKAQELMQRFHEASMKTRPKVEKKPTQAQVTFGYGGGSSLKSYGTLKGGLGIKKNPGGSSEGGGAYSGGREIKEYKEPWDYYTYYPLTLPLRRPYSGNPELLDKEEFGEASETVSDNEQSTNSAVELGLMEDNLEASMIFFQLPESMPIRKQLVKEEGNASTSRPVKVPRPSVKGCGLDELPAGLMGKMLVYKSGAVKLKLGDILYDVSAGLNCVFAQDVAAINTEEKHFCIVGELNKRAILTPDVDSIVQNLSDL